MCANILSFNYQKQRKLKLTRLIIIYVYSNYFILYSVYFCLTILYYIIILYIVCCRERFYLEHEDSYRARSISRVAPKFRATRAKTRDDVGQKMADFAAGIFFLRNRPLADALHLSISIFKDE